MRYKIYLLCIYCLFTTAAFAQHKTKKAGKAAVKKSLPAVQIALKRLVTDKSMDHAGIGFCMRDMQDGKTVVAHNQSLSLSPASTMKMVTTATALEILGKDFRFTTRLQYAGKIDKQGVLHGNVIIRGGGDPTFGFKRVEGSASFEEIFSGWANQISNLGIKRIEGGIIADACFFEQQMNPYDWSWSDMGNYYGAGASGLSIYENMFVLNLQGGAKTGDSVKLRKIYPELKDLKIDLSRIRTGDSETDDEAYIFGAPYQEERYVTGALPIGSDATEVKGSIPNPPLFAAKAFKAVLQGQGIEADGKAMVILNPKDWINIDTNGITTMLSYSSPTLSEIIRHTNHKSINLYAETLLKMMGKQKYGEGSTEAGTNAVYAYWKSKGLKLDGFFMRDGSGLSRNNAIYPALLVNMLYIMHGDPLYDVFFQSLPTAGENGILPKDRGGKRIRLKSGHMNKVRAFAGYTTLGGKQYCFSLIVNNYDGNKKEIKQKIRAFINELVD